jgi:endoglucanase
MPQGLEWAQMSHLLDFIAHNKFNALRVPLSVSSVLDDNKMPDTFGGSVLQNNPRLHNLHYMHVLHVLISEAAARNLLVLLDLHRLTAGDRDNPLWYDSRVSEQMLVGAWGRLAARHCDNWNVVGAECVRKARNNRPHGPVHCVHTALVPLPCGVFGLDWSAIESRRCSLFNEPWAAAWGGNSTAEDWAAAAERIAAAVERACPRWLLFVEGVSHTTGSGAPSAGSSQTEEGHNWAANVEGARTRPLAIRAAKRVYSPHVYGPSVAPQPYFSNESFPANIPPIWHAHFGYLAGRTGCVVVGEWGGFFEGADEVWQRAFATWLSEHRIGSFYWALNPTSRDTGGLLLDDWKTPSTNKLALLRQIQGTLRAG